MTFIFTAYFDFECQSSQDRTDQVFVPRYFLVFYEVIIKFTILVDFDKFSFLFFGYSLRSSSNPSMFSIPTTIPACQQRGASCLLPVLYDYLTCYYFVIILKMKGCQNKRIKAESEPRKTLIFNTDLEMSSYLYSKPNKYEPSLFQVFALLHIQQSSQKYLLCYGLQTLFTSC